MVSVSADTAALAVTMVLLLTEATCVPLSQNVTVQTETRGSITPQLYTQDLAITAVMCFIGGVGLTLLVLLIYYQVFHRKTLKKCKRQKDKEERISKTLNHHVSHLEEKRRNVLLHASNSQPRDREAMMLDTALENPSGQFWSRVDEAGSHFRCPDCSARGERGVGPNLMRWNNNRINREMEVEEEREKRRIRIIEEDRRKPGIQEEDQLLEIANDGGLKSMFETTTLPVFWIKVMTEYPEIATTALKTLLPFPTSYLCEAGFSAVTATKTKQRSRHTSGVIVSYPITPTWDRLVAEKQVQGSH